MECREIQENLNNYIEGLFPPETVRLYEEHFALCSKCSGDLSDLRRSIELVTGLEEIEPPQWLTQKVMARVREEAASKQKKGIFENLFSSFNLPLKAAAGFAIVVIAIVIFRDIRPVVQNTASVSEETAKQGPHRKKKVPRVIKREAVQTQAAAEKKDSPLPYTSSPMPAAGGYGSSEKLSEAQKSPAPVPEQNKAGSNAFAPAPAAPAKGEIRDDMRLEAKAAPVLKAKEETRAYNILFTVNVKEIGSAKKEVWKALSQSGAKVGRSEAYKDKYVFSAEVDPSKVKELNDRLKNIGEVKQKDIDTSKTQGNLSVKIEIIGM